MGRINVGDVVRHYKYDSLSPEDKLKRKYTYQVLNIAKHTETNGALVIYQALYGDFDIWARPYDMFMGRISDGRFRFTSTRKNKDEKFIFES